MIKIAPSILSADFSRLGEEVSRLERAGADWVHVDVMDGCFVPNITIGPVVIRSIRDRSRLPFDVHLMIVEPGRFIDQFAEAGADIITVHAESTSDLKGVLKKIRARGKMVGISINPETPVSAVRHLLDEIDLLLVMTVRPGFAGQSFMEEILPKISEAREYVDSKGLKLEIEVDGGINSLTAPEVVRAGATVLAAGSHLFNHPDMAAEINRWKLFG